MLLTVLTALWWLPVYLLVVLFHHVVLVRLQVSDGRIIRDATRGRSTDRSASRALSAALLLTVVLPLGVLGATGPAWAALAAVVVVVAVGLGVGAIVFSVRDRRRLAESARMFHDDRSRIVAEALPPD